MPSPKRRRLWEEYGYCFEDWPDASDCRPIDPSEVTSKRERKLQDRLNRIENLLPGKHRLWELDRIADELAIEADLDDGADTERLRRDALTLSRLAWDMMEMRDTVRGNPRKTDLSRYDPANWPRGPRP